MRLWPFGRREQRQSYTDVLTTALVNAASGNTLVSAAATAALETACGIMGRAFASAQVKGDGGVLNVSMLTDIGRRLIRYGEVIYDIEVDGSGAIRLQHCTQNSVHGGPRPESWVYRLSLHGPSSSPVRMRPWASVVHLTYSTDPDRPWIGVSPLGWASQTGTLAGALERALGDEQQGTLGYLLPLPTDGMTDDDITAFKNDLRNLRGRTSVVETTAAGLGRGRSEAPQRDYQAQRLGPEVPESSVALHAQVFNQVLAACGIPVDLGVPLTSSNASQRESWRQFVYSTVQPLASHVAGELSRKLERQVSFDFEELGAADVAARARAYGSLVQGGMQAARAERVAGLDQTVS